MQNSSNAKRSQPQVYMNFSIKDILQHVRNMVHQPLGSFVTRTWLCERLAGAPSAELMNAFTSRRRPKPLSQEAEMALKSSMFHHQKAIRLLKLSVVGHCIDHETVRGALEQITIALEEYGKLRYTPDFYNCLCDFESLLNTILCFGSLYAVTKKWAQHFREILSKKGLAMPGMPATQYKGNFFEGDRRLRSIVMSCRRAMAEMEAKGKLPVNAEGHSGTGSFINGNTGTELTVSAPNQSFNYASHVDYLNSAVAVRAPVVNSVQTNAIQIYRQPSQSAASTSVSLFSSLSRSSSSSPLSSSSLMTIPMTIPDSRPFSQLTDNLNFRHRITEGSELLPYSASNSQQLIYSHCPSHAPACNFVPAYSKGSKRPQEFDEEEKRLPPNIRRETLTPVPSHTQFRFGSGSSHGFNSMYPPLSTSSFLGPPISTNSSNVVTVPYCPYNEYLAFDRSKIVNSHVVQQIDNADQQSLDSDAVVDLTPVDGFKNTDVAKIRHPAVWRPQFASDINFSTNTYPFEQGVNAGARVYFC